MLPKPPLPFQGNKGQGRKEFISIIDKIPEPENKTYVDLFGGSLFLSYIVKHMYPNATVIANDYDNYKARLDNVSDTNELLSQIRHIVKDIPKDKKLSDETTNKIKDVIKTFDGFVDPITLSASLLYSGKYCNSKDELLKHKPYYSKMKHNDYNIQEAKDYTKGLVIVCCDWLDLFTKYKDRSDVVFIADPPYLYTDKAGYNNKYWRLYDSLKTFDVMRQERYIYYTSTKSGLLDVLEYFVNNFNIDLNFNKLTINRIKSNKYVIENSEIVLYNV